ncbi:inhibitor of apoptosis 3 [Adoxophyes honmai entomopoxvirus 'L']|uniref:Inhibitor of apoptosis 3 n=1 Tax=Adoxophyes honmai entomopoxvirus 'L' TaxID=1293540 RepID=A0A916KNX1_9POXV|nr:inhibitor of apoptosis 3 [Adoxophyes honmai entomopoxvirus 'L']CCU55358.1 inhibitor of apoptosis 3 [Adoxophyes honmai entomopoxvirus 'L']
MESEQLRLDSFINHIEENKILCERAAQIGYYLVENDNKSFIKCAFCNVIIVDWKTNNCIFNEHDYDCVLIKDTLECGNIPIDKNLIIYSNVGVCHSKYILEIDRIKSFSNWPKYMNPRPKELAEAGLFYTNVSDNVKCFCCNVGLNNWKPDDDPWEEHTKFSKFCLYVNIIKDRKYIQYIIDKNKNDKNINFDIPDIELNNTQDNGNPCNICITNDKNSVYIPCGHCYSCAKCSFTLLLMTNKCPICNEKIKNFQKIYYC